MAMNDVVRELRDFDFSDLDIEKIGSWPMAIKVIVWAIVFIAVLVLGYMYDVSDLQADLAKQQQKELDLKSQFERKAFQAANLNAYRNQMAEMEESFGALISQLPSDTEVPGLLEDITNKGLASGLDINSITLGNERSAEFYVELPIEIEVRGNYHDLGTFVSGIAGLPRIVTLHDFKITQSEASALIMKITAKTYRYKDLGGMMPRYLSLKLLGLAASVLLTACSGGNYQDIDSFMSDKKSRPAGLIKPLPVFKSYKAFTYSAAGLRSPFEKPIEVTEITRLRMASNVKPDKNRTKEYLEQFSIDSLSMVGTLQQGGFLWALLQDEDGGVHRVRKDNYLGRNHGRIVEATETYLSVIEIVPNGVDGWVDRPRTIKLKTLEEE